MSQRNRETSVRGYNKSNVRMCRTADTSGVALPGALGATLAVPLPGRKQHSLNDWIGFYCLKPTADQRTLRDSVSRQSKKH